MQQYDVDVVRAQLAAESDPGRPPHLFRRRGVRLGEHSHFFPRQALQRQLGMGMRAVLVGAIEEIQTLVIAGAEQIGETMHTEFLGLVGTAADAVGASAHGKAASQDLADPSSTRSVAFFLVVPANKRIGEMVQGDGTGRLRQRHARSGGDSSHPPVLQLLQQYHESQISEGQGPLGFSKAQRPRSAAPNSQGTHDQHLPRAWPFCASFFKSAKAAIRGAKQPRNSPIRHLPRRRRLREFFKTFVVMAIVSGQARTALRATLR